MDKVRPDIIMEKVYGLFPGLTLPAGLQTDIGDKNLLFTKESIENP